MLTNFMVVIILHCTHVSVGSDSKESALSLGWEDLLEKGMDIHSSILAWRIPWTVQGRKELDMTE